jgi:hypothetical protein
MNKGKPSGFKADTKKDAGAKSTSRPRSGQAGAGPEWTESEETQTAEAVTSHALREVAEQNGGDAALNPFPELPIGAPGNGTGRSRIVHLELSQANASKVCVAGTFNDWRPDASEMIPIGDGKWRKDLTLPPGEYEYRFVVDGNWLTDPQCDREKPNGLGESNSVLLVPES